MKTFAKLSIIIFIVGAVCAPGVLYSQFDPTKFKSFTIEFRPDPGDVNKLEIITSPQGWEKNGKAQGYVGFDEGEFGTITFQMRNQPADRCNTPPGPSAHWVITKIEFSDEGDSGNQKGGNFNANQAEWLKRSFLGVNDKGLLFEHTDKMDGRTSTGVINLNDHPKGWGTKLAYYRVTAMKCTDGSERIADPGVGNRGK